MSHPTAGWSSQAPPKRASELKETISSLLTKVRMSVVEAQKLRGRMQFVDGQIFGRLGRLCMRAITQHAFPFKGERLERNTIDAMKRFSIFLDYPEPRSLELASNVVWNIYTDSCYEPTRKDWQCGLGGVLVNHLGQKLEFFSGQLTQDQMIELGVMQKKTIIFEAELLALVLAFSLWRVQLRSASLVCFVDNNSARDVAISGSGRNTTANCLIDFLLKLEMASGVSPWFSRVPTPSNIADEPSRGDCSVLLEQGAHQIDHHTQLVDILQVLSEVTDKRGWGASWRLIYRSAVALACLEWLFKWETSSCGGHYILAQWRGSEGTNTHSGWLQKERPTTGIFLSCKFWGCRLQNSMNSPKCPAAYKHSWDQKASPWSTCLWTPPRLSAKEQQ